MKEVYSKSFILTYFEKNKQFPYVPVLPLYKNWSIDFQSKLISWFLYNGNTGLKWVKWNPWKSRWSFNVRPKCKSLPVDTQPNLDVHRTFIWRSDHYMNVLFMFFFSVIALLERFSLSTTVLSFGIGHFRIRNSRKNSEVWIVIE